MSSTTSSDCESCECSQCTYLFENNHNDYGKLLMNSRHVPMYATMAHPLVYYAEVQQPLNRRQKYDQPRKDNPFKKAFTWYTQERTLYNKNDVAPERSRFANWLDNKYVEYLRESGQQTKGLPTSHDPRTPRIPESCPPCPGTTKKFGRFKSPWRKRRRSGNDSGDVPEKCPDGSCEFLLQPKELTRAASETCCHTSGGKSSSTVASSNLPCNTKCSGRSHSLSDVAREKSVIKHGDTVPHAVQECPNCQDQAPTKLVTTSGVCHQNQQGRTKLPNLMCACPQVQGTSKEQHATNQPTTLCKCPQEKVPCCKYLQEQITEVERVPTKEQYPTNQPKPLQEEVPKVVKVLSKEQDPTNQLQPLQEKVPKVPSKVQDPTNQLQPLQEKVPKVPSKVQDPTNQLQPLQEKVPKVPSKVQDPTNQLQPRQEIVPKVPSKVQDPTNQLQPRQEIVPKVPSKVQDPTNQLQPRQEIVPKVPSKVQYPTNQLQPLQEKVPKVPSKVQDPTNQLQPLEEKVPKVPSKVQDPTNQLELCCKCNLEKVPTKEQYPMNQQKPFQEEVPKVVKVLSKEQDPTVQLKPLQEKLPKVPSKVQDPTNQLQPLQEKLPKVPSKVQDPTNQLGPCCKCNLEKVPKVVQVPSQSRAVEESSQYPEEKIVPVHEETQYEPTPTSPRNTQNPGPCCCKTCNKQIPTPPQLVCIPVKVQSNKIESPEMCLAIASAQIDAPKKQTAKLLSASYQSGEGNKSKVGTQSQHQPEPSACCKDTTPSQSNCHEVNQVFGPIPVRRQSYSTVAINEETGEYTIVKEVSVVNKFTRSVTCASNDAAQTSDHSIRFEKDDCSCQYPLFFKIIYADKN